MGNPPGHGTYNDDLLSVARSNEARACTEVGDGL